MQRPGNDGAFGGRCNARELHATPLHALPIESDNLADLHSIPKPMDAKQPPVPTPFEIKDLFHIGDHQEDIPWSPYKKGVEIFRLYGDGISGPTAALLRYREAGEVPIHEHPGYEHIFVLSGSQEDDHGVFNAGTVVINAPGTRHKVRSGAGCIVLAIYEKPVRFLEVSE